MSALNANTAANISTTSTSPAISSLRAAPVAGSFRPSGRPVEHAAFPQYSRSRLADQCGVDITQICKVLNGSAGPSVDLAQRMAKAIGVEIGAFLDELQRTKLARKKNKSKKSKSESKSKLKSKSIKSNHKKG